MQYVKDQVRYNLMAPQNRRCKDCRFYAHPHQCQIVDGFIDERATCGKWAKGKTMTGRQKPYRFVYPQTGDLIMPGHPTTDPVTSAALFKIGQLVVMPGGKAGVVKHRSRQKDGLTWAYGVIPVGAKKLPRLKTFIEADLVHYKQSTITDLVDIRMDVATGRKSLKEGIQGVFGTLQRAGVHVNPGKGPGGWGYLKAGRKKIAVLPLLNMVPQARQLGIDLPGATVDIDKAVEALDIWNNKIIPLYNDKKKGRATASSSQKGNWDRTIKARYDNIKNSINLLESFVDGTLKGADLFKDAVGESYEWVASQASSAVETGSEKVKDVWEKATGWFGLGNTGLGIAPIIVIAALIILILLLWKLLQAFGWLPTEEEEEDDEAEDEDDEDNGNGNGDDDEDRAYGEEYPPCEYAAEGESDWWFGTHDTKSYSMKVSQLGKAGPKKDWYITPTIDIPGAPKSWNETGADILNGLLWALVLGVGLAMLPHLFKAYGAILHIVR